MKIAALAYKIPAAYRKVEKEHTLAYLDSVLGVHQRMLNTALNAFMTGGKCTAKMLISIGYSDQKQVVRKSAVLHAKFIMACMDINASKDLYDHESLLEEWFGRSVFFENIEYVQRRGSWFVREWKEYTVSKPAYSCGVLYYNHDDAKTTNAGPSFIGRKGTQAVNTKMQSVHNVTSQSDRILRNAYAQIGAHRKQFQVRETAEHVIRFKRITVQELVMQRVGTLNNAVEQCLNASRAIGLMLPKNPPDASYHVTRGLTELRGLLTFLSVTTRNADHPVRVFPIAPYTITHEKMQYNDLTVATKALQSMQDWQENLTEYRK